MTSVRALFRSGFHELSTRPAEQVPVLDALRTLAVLLVIVEHCVASVVPELAGAKGGILEHPIFQFGWTGVDLFFILSGYLIGRQLWREAQRTGTVDVPRFVLRRGFRIWPLYVFFIIVSSLILARAPRLSDMLFYSNYAGGQVQGGWSLSTEEQFYIVMPLAAMLLGRWGMKIWLALIPLMIAGVLVARAITAPILLSHGMSLAAVKDAMYFPAHLRSEALYVGLLIALVSTLRPAWFARPRDAGFSWTGFGIAVASTLSAGVLRKLNGVVFPFFSLALIFGGLTTWLLLDRSWVSRALRGHVFYVISRLSYGMYLGHLWVIGLMLPPLLRVVTPATGTGTLSGIVIVVLMIALSTAVAAVTFVLVEHPFLVMRGHVMRPRAQGIIATPGATAAEQPSKESAPEPIPAPGSVVA